MFYVLLVIIILNFFTSFLFQFRRDLSALHKQILISMGSYFPEVRALGTLITSAYNLQNSLTMPTIDEPYLDSLAFVLNNCRLIDLTKY